MRLPRGNSGSGRVTAMRKSAKRQNGGYFRIVHLTGQSLPILIQEILKVLILVRILVRRFESRLSWFFEVPLGIERRNISMTC